MAAEGKEKEGSSSMVIIFSALLALGAAGGVYYFYDEAAKAESMLNRAKDEYKKMAERKRPVEDFLRSRKGRPTAPSNNEDMLVFLDKKARESQIPPGSITFAKNPPNQLKDWMEVPFLATLQGNKDAGVKRLTVVDFLRKVETERRSTKVKSLQLLFGGDEFKSATITLSEFTSK
jgi:hypothetical protein